MDRSAAVLPPLGRPQRSVRLADQIYGLLLGEISAGRYSPGDRLAPEPELSESYAVSRPVLREALVRLKADGFLVSRQGAGTFVARRPPERLLTLTGIGDVARHLRTFEIRSALEGSAARFAALRRGDDDLAAIQAANGALQAALQANAATAALDLAFHRAIWKASGNDLFPEILDGLNETIVHGMTVGVGLNSDVSRDFMQRIAQEHMRIMEAIQAGEPESASLAMQYHVDQARRRLTERTQTRP